ncbi:MAG TPA: MauE/DoxX family redox-associated membrane protein [Acidimicrobiia bacterium]|nr:MauE/DoxX family redox-associated membrane protein [Acidimicrobiia bacterium]
MAAQVDTGISVVVGAIVLVAAIAKLRAPAVFARTLTRLSPRLRRRRPTWARPLAIAFSVAEATVAVAVIALRGAAGVAAAAGLLVLTCGFVAAVARAIHVGTACSCFGRLGNTAAGGRELGRALALTALAAAVLGLRAHDPAAAIALGVAAVVAGLGAFVVIVAAQAIGGVLRPGRRADVMPGGGSLLGAVRDAVGYDGALVANRPAPPGAPGSSSPVPAGDLARDVGVLRASGTMQAVVDELERRQCHPPRWEQARATRIAATPSAPEIDVVSIPVERGCLLVARLTAADPPRVRQVTGCHHNECVTEMATD